MWRGSAWRRSAKFLYWIEKLEKESIDTQLSSLLNVFHTDELSLDVIDEEVEIVRQQIYDRQVILKKC
jgi:predicted DNA-binding protein YlxM (UPF0122 family)